MKSNFPGFEPDSTSSNSEFENIELDCFELLSAYIDGELSISEKERVQRWLDQDPKIKNLYTKLLGLQIHMQQAAVPPSQKSIEEITEGVFDAINVVDSHRLKRRIVLGTSAITATLLAAIAGSFGGNSSLQIANNKDDSNTTISNVTMLAVAVNKPAINIPKTASGNPFNLEWYSK